MALVIDTIAMRPTYLPYERMPDPAALWTAVPRGLRGFFTESALSAKPVNDDQIVNLTGTLSPNYAYVFAEIGVLMTQNRAADWESVYTLNLGSWYQGLTSVAMDWNFDWPLVGFDQQRRGNGLSKNPMPSAPMWAPSDSSGILINISGSNGNNTVATAGVINGYINFWEFDLEQARKFPINSPIPVHAR